MTQPTVTPKIVEESGWGTLEVFELEPSESVLQTLLTDLFENHWDQIRFGPLIQGAVWEIKAVDAPKRVSMLDGYLTVDFGPWHFHVCIGEHQGTRSHPTPSELAQHRRTARAELYRQINDDGTPNSWGLRLFNGHDEQQITVFFPNPFLSDAMQVLKTPDWSHLDLWDEVRKTYLGLQPDDRDRSGRRMIHG
jgi:hypothetical protein